MTKEKGVMEEQTNPRGEKKEQFQQVINQIQTIELFLLNQLKSIVTEGGKKPFTEADLEIPLMDSLTINQNWEGENKDLRIKGNEFPLLISYLEGAVKRSKIVREKIINY
jgi:hypothetical protein